jgi:hypothetical protein
MIIIVSLFKLLFKNSLAERSSLQTDNENCVNKTKQNRKNYLTLSIEGLWSDREERNN